MKKTSIIIAVILVFWSAFGFSQNAPLPGVTVPVQKQSPPVRDSGETFDDPKQMTDIHDIKPLVSVPVPISWASVVLWTVACITTGGLLWGAWLLWRRRRGTSAETIEAVLSPEETALQRLASLSSKTGMEGKSYYFQLSFIFREYLQGRFGIDGLEMTTEELLPHVEKLTIDKDLKRDAKNFIVSCDPVKYASAPAFQESMSADFNFVKTFVEKTTATVENSAETEDGQTTGFQE